MRRILCLLLVLAFATPLFAARKEKGKFDLFLNGINKGYEKYKVQEKRGEKIYSSEVKFQMPMPKAKRGYVELYLYPTIKFRQDSGKFEGYSYRISFNDFSKMEMVEAQNSANEVVDQDFGYYPTDNPGAPGNQDTPSSGNPYGLDYRQRQQQNYEFRNHIDLGVNAGKVEPIGQTLHFKQMRFSNSRVKDEPLPKKVTVLDAYTFVPYLVLAERAKTMKGDSEPLKIVFPQAMGLKDGKLEYMGTDRTPVDSKQYILKHYSVTVGGDMVSSFWVDTANKVVQIVVPSQGLIAILSGYTPKPFKREMPRIFKQAVEVGGGFQEKRVHIPSGDITIGATLTLPSGSAPFPTILMVQDLEPLDRDGNDPSNPYSRAGTWKQLAYYLASEGFASLRYDSRGVGETGGDSAKLELGDVTRDAVNMVKWLEDQPTTKGKAVVLLSQGLGGWAAAQAAAKVPVRGLVAIGYPAKDITRLWREQASGMMDPQARQQAYLDLDNLDAILRSKGPKGQEWIKFRGRKVFVPGVRTMQAVNPLALAASLKVPCLFAYPDKDRIVMPFHKDVLADSLNKGQEEIVLKGLGHHLTEMSKDNRPTGIVDGKRLQPVSDWLKKLFTEASPASP
jgi:dienelactone hydrolase